MYKLALLILTATAAQAAIIQVNPNEIDITFSTTLDSTGNGFSSQATAIYLLGTHLYVTFNPGTPGYPALFGCAIGPAFCSSSDHVDVDIAGIGDVSMSLEIQNTENGGADASGSGYGNFPSVTPGVYQLTAFVQSAYSSNTDAIPTGTLVNTIVIQAEELGVSLSPYTFPIPEPGTWMLAGIGVVAFTVGKLISWSCRRWGTGQRDALPASNSTSVSRA
jgi:hypothetical protein